MKNKAVKTLRKFVGCMLAASLMACPSDLKTALRAYGYLPVRPASSLWLPGSVVYIKSSDPLEVGFICTAKQMMGSDFVAMESVTTSSELSRASRRGITMAAHVQDIVTADAELQDIKSVKLNLRNVKVMELTDWDVAQAANKADPRCIRAIQRRRQQGFEVTLISAAIQADVIFSVSFSQSAKLDVDAKVAAVQNLSAKLGVDANRVNDRAIEGQGLIFGIRSDEYLAWLLDPQHLPKVDRGSSIISSDTQSQLEVLLKTAPQPQDVLQDPTQHVQPLPDVEETPEEQQPLPEPTPDFVPDLPVPTPRAPKVRNPNRNSSAF